MMTKIKVNRRTFIVSSIATAGALVLGLGLTRGMLKGSDAAADSTTFNAFLKIGQDDTITIQVPCSEMGQGVFTALPMILAEELEADWTKVVAVTAPADKAYHYPDWGDQLTGGSHAVAGWYAALRHMGATAREMLVAAAAQEWGVPASTCKADRNVVSHPESGRSLRYGAIAEAAAKQPVPKSPTLKSVDKFNLIGHPVPRKDTPVKVDGSAIYGVDVRLPGMLTAAVKTSPSFGGRVVSYDAKKAMAMPGVRGVVPIPDGIAVAADSYWQARKALDAMEIIFEPGPFAHQSSEKIRAELIAGLEKEGVVARDDGKARATLAAANNVYSAVYEAPYLAHACMEPMSCTADVRTDACEIWVPTQWPRDTRQRVAGWTKLPLEKVQINVTFLGGGFGRRGEADFVEQAVLVSKALGKPVKVIWSREEDIAHDFYRPAAAIRFQAALDKKGNGLAFDCRVSAPSIMARTDGLPVGKLDSAAVEGLADQPYAFPHARVEYVRSDLGVPVGWWRSVGNSHNAFMRESFIDELAHAQGEDPYQFRRRLLAHDKRHLGVLDLAASKAGWNSPLPAGHFRGIAVAKSFETYVAEVAEISIKDGEIKTHKVTCAIDCGTVVNPGIIEAQMQSAIIDGLTAALKGEITILDGAVEQSNFHDYPMLYIADIPEIAVHIVNSTEAPTGAGEPGVPPVAPAVANAVFAATGQRIRSLPFSKHTLKGA